MTQPNEPTTPMVLSVYSPEEPDPPAILAHEFRVRPPQQEHHDA